MLVLLCCCCCPVSSRLAPRNPPFTFPVWASTLSFGFLCQKEEKGVGERMKEGDTQRERDRDTGQTPEHAQIVSNLLWSKRLAHGRRRTGKEREENNNNKGKRERERRGEQAERSRPQPQRNRSYRERKGNKGKGRKSEAEKSKEEEKKRKKSQTRASKPQQLLEPISQ